MTRAPRAPRLGLTVGATVVAVALAVGGCTGTQPSEADGWRRGAPPLTTPWTDEVGPGDALPEYPRPQLARPTAADPDWLDLNGVWQYEAWDGSGAIPFGTDLPGTILVPYPEESALSGVQEHADHALYRTTVEVPDRYVADGGRVRLHFGAVSHEATVYVNGRQVAQHAGGYDAFSADITPALRATGTQEIVVAVDSPVDAAAVPVGKQRLEPGGIFYTASSGIWQTVWLEPVPPVSIATLVATPDVDTSTFTTTATFHGDAAGARLAIDAYADGVKVATASGPAASALTLTVREPRLWTPDDPFLYTFTATLSGPGVHDAVETYAGLREIAVENVGGKQRITLNHVPTFLLATLDQGFWPDGIYTAPTDDALRFDIEKTKDLGFNAIRKHVKVEPARWYAWADRLGVLVWQDIPSMPNGRNDTLTPGDQQGFRAETTRIVDQLRGVTSVIGWVTFNEGWGQWSVQAASDLAAQVKAQDPSRLVDAASGVNCCDVPTDSGGGDVVDWHVYQGPALPSPGTRRAAVDGEHGGLSLPVDGHAWPGADLNPYGAVPDRDALTAGYVANTTAMLRSAAAYGISGSVYTQITDVETEQNGLLTYDRRVVKVDEDAVRAVNRQTIAAGSR
ncbi:glycoside hydrolase family 2 protein [Xylanimonas protaetiae]|uniref:Glycoside hydrolase family 2 n=1 Tax=Xylanimonas protaetiae TaxID=2509457 RepID=A0A4P6F8U7_9MICO|nr:sugar-binding domain-containing protein [Xylanimonas protaetiae]QAY70759.1 glycoside hydrolase family 2 [Xylanimonas protaetiae]